MPNFEQLKAKLSSEMREAIKKESLNNISGLFRLVDPDDYIGADFALWNYQVENAGSAGMPLQMNFGQSGVHYEITGQLCQNELKLEKLGAFNTSTYNPLCHHRLTNAEFP